MNYQGYLAMVNTALEERCRPSLESHKMASQRFCLRWNNHQTNLLSVFDQLFQEQCFVDVTLAVEGKFLRAHKMVLSACSPYFQTLFTEHPDKHPIVILKDVPYADMRCLLDFMYRGEVSVNQDRLTAFLKVAETLRIKGLTEVNEERGSSAANSSGSSLNSSLPLPPPQLHRINNQRVPPYNQHPMPGAAASLLGSALTVPKRKRGRPRKLSGSSEMEPDSDGERGADSGINLPELLEVNMDDGRDERCSNGGTDGDRDADMDEDDPIGTSPAMPSQRHNPFQLEDLLKPKTERRSSEESISFDYPSIKREPDSPYSGGGVVNTSGYAGGGGDTGPPTPTSAASPSNPHKNTVRRRMRRRANSSSQDPAEQLTEMSVRESTGEVTCDTESVVKVEIKSEPEEGEVTATDSGVHFLTDEGITEKASQDSINEIIDNLPKARSDLLEYLMQPDGTVVCKRCGEILPSRTHWYRHKYKQHVPVAGLPAGLVKCIKCNTFFKSRKGYVGHCIARHGSVAAAERDDEEEETTVIKTEQVEYDEDVENVAVNEDVEPPSPPPTTRKKRVFKDELKEDYMRQREREEKLVADIIAKVKRECEAQSITMCRRGYSRRSTVMTSFKEYDQRNK